MAKLEIRDKIAERIYQWHESRRDPPRRYLGASVIGESCERRLWYSFRWAGEELFSGRMLRLFETGDLEEPRVVDELRGIGCEVRDIDPKTGRQFRFNDLGGHFSGGCDGMVLGVPGAEKTWHLLEIKTSNAKRFAQLKKEGVAKSNPKHLDQMQIYMHAFGLKRALYICKNKDTDELYTERVHYDKEHAEGVRKKAERIISAERPPARISDDPTWYECKFCPFHAHCRGWQVADVSCRTCAHSTPTPDGKWQCERYSCEIPDDKQRKGCLNHLHIPELVPFAKAVEAGDDFVVYEMGNGKRFAEVGESGMPGKDVPHYSSRELVRANPDAIGNPAVEAARTVLEGEAE